MQAFSPLFFKHFFAPLTFLQNKRKNPRKESFRPQYVLFGMADRQ